ncbi:hypothetical protein [Clostridium lacusfryxellense]|uniref:hypothetical protein n=1 Tax=Clostridium lacusfryxellense TaxID=205328 RepID=UPI001C0AF571|nr:hypothetical protein [Clostridium lacusfryxellense]MBU3110408.1 hypothetical protein [Clostridium lacusfryxellense]
MRYTRYNYKAPKKNNNFIIIITLTLIVAIALGTVFSKLLPHNMQGTSTTDKTTKVSLEKDAVDTSKSTAVSNSIDYVALQCGVFSNKDSALQLKNSLTEFGTPFIIVEGNLNKVILGVYPSGGVESVIKQLNAKKITFVKISYKLDGSDSTSAQTNEMISADVKILNKLSEKDTKLYKTADLKKWMLTLKGADEKSKNYSNMSEIKTYLTALPQEFKKEKTEEGYIYIYKFIKKMLKA